MNPASVLTAPALRDFVERILAAAGAPAAKAQLVAECLVAANLRGVDSHGVLLLPFYLAQIRSGNVRVAEEGAIVSESGACLLYDGRLGLGQTVSAVCCEHVVRLARQHGVSMVVARNSNHFGAAAFWALRISGCGMMGIVVSNASASVPPWQGREGRIGTNPICMSVPSAPPGGWLLDMATTTVAKNRIVKFASSGQATIPAGWAMDPDGVPTTDAQEALRGLLMPLGGYKGSGLGLMVEILCAVLGGGAMGTAVGGLYYTDRPMNTSHAFLAIDAGRFLPPDLFQSRMEHLVGMIKSTLPAAGYDEVLVAGDPEWRVEAQRLREGIPIEAGVWDRLVALADELGVPLPDLQ